MDSMKVGGKKNGVSMKNVSRADGSASVALTVFRSAYKHLPMI